MSCRGDNDVFIPNGQLRQEAFCPKSAECLAEAVKFANTTRWESVRSPHVFMGLLASPDAAMKNWGERLRADLGRLLAQFQELFHQEDGEEMPTLLLNREFLSDNVIRLLRLAYQRALDNDREHVTTMDLLISLLSAKNSIVAECFERIGVSAGRLTELAELVEQQPRQS